MIIPKNIRKMTLGERAKAGIGAVGPRHPKMREFIRKMGSMATSGQEPESDDEPAPSDPAEEEGETEAPNLRRAEACGNCMHFDAMSDTGEGSRCAKHNCDCEATDTCDDFEEATADSEQGAEMTGEY